MTGAALVAAALVTAAALVIFITGWGWPVLIALVVYELAGTVLVLRLLGVRWSDLQ